MYYYKSQYVYFAQVYLSLGKLTFILLLQYTLHHKTLRWLSVHEKRYVIIGIIIISYKFLKVMVSFTLFCYFSMTFNPRTSCKDLNALH